MEDQRRLLPLIGAGNSGSRRLPDHPGRAVRWRLLYRSDSLHELTQSDVDVLHEAGLSTIIDLRSLEEVERTGRGLLRNEPVRYLHTSVLQEEDAQTGVRWRCSDER